MRDMSAVLSTSVSTRITDSDRPVSPRPDKSLCDGSRCILLDEAQELFEEAVERGMISTYKLDKYPKYVWAVDGDGRVYEAKLEKGGNAYHGYELGEDEAAMRQRVIEEWKIR